MRKSIRIAVFIVAMVSMFSICALAANNSYEVYMFTENGKKLTSSLIEKEDDGDRYVYVTTISNQPNGSASMTSNVFINDGCFYARARQAANENNKSDLFSFTTYEAQRKPYLSEPAWGDHYKLVGEIDHTNFTSYTAIQWVRWCP